MPFLKWFLLFTIGLLFSFFHRAEAIERAYRFETSLSELQVIQEHDFFFTTISGSPLYTEVGRPPLPYIEKIIVIPEGMQLSTVNSTIDKAVSLPLQRNVLLCQPSSNGSSENLIETPLIDAPSLPWSYPESLFSIHNVSGPGNMNIIRVRVFPLHYESHGLEFRVTVYTGVTVHFQFAKMQSEHENSPTKLSDFASRYLRSRLLNPEDLESFTSRTGLEHWVLISSESLLPAFDDLVQWRQESGFMVTRVSIETIIAHSTGVDDAEKVRNFIISLNNSDPVHYLLLGGDTDIIPARIANASSCSSGTYPDENDLVSDLYYSDLDGTWDDETTPDGVYGEIEDSIDLEADVLVGRIPLRTTPEIRNWVSKVLDYEKSPDGTSVMKAMFWAAEVAPSVPVGGILDTAEGFLENYTITKEYDSELAAVLATWNTGQGLVCHEAHSFYHYLGAADGELFDEDDINDLNAAGMSAVCYSVGCYGGAFDFPKTGYPGQGICEFLLGSPHMTTCAFIGNSRNGWFNQFVPLIGESAIYFRNFFFERVLHKMHRIGDAFAAAKSDAIASSQTANYFRCLQFGLNLLADPAMHLWMKQPEALTADLSFPGTGQLAITVMKDGIALEDARVCLYRKDEVQRVLTTDSDGYCLFTSIPQLSGLARLTVTFPEALPYQVDVNVSGIAVPFHFEIFAVVFVFLNCCILLFSRQKCFHDLG